MNDLLRRRPGAVVAAALLWVILVGCGSDEPAEEPADAESSSAAATESTEASEASESAETTSAEEDGGRITAAGVSFDRPQGWVTIKAEDIQSAAEGNSDFADVAEELGMSADELIQTIGAAELLLIDPSSDENGLGDNINVVLPGGAMPSQAQLKQQFTQIGATVQDVTTQESDLGEVVTVNYELPVAAGTVQGTTLVTEASGEMVTITVSTTARNRTNGLVERILASGRVA